MTAPNIVPTPHTRRMAVRMIEDATASCGADAALEHIGRVDPAQYVALIGLLLANARGSGRPRKPVTYTAEQRRDAHRRWAAGETSEWVLVGEREYQRVAGAKRRARLREVS